MDGNKKRLIYNESNDIFDILKSKILGKKK